MNYKCAPVRLRWPDKQEMVALPQRGAVMTIRRFIRAAAPFAIVLAVTGCAMFPEGDSTCTGQGPNSASWPYCAPSEPGGPGPVDDPIDPTGRSVSG